MGLLAGVGGRWRRRSLRLRTAFGHGYSMVDPSVCHLAASGLPRMKPAGERWLAPSPARRHLPGVAGAARARSVPGACAAMEWQDDALVLSVRPHGENDSILVALTL